MNLTLAVFPAHGLLRVTVIGRYTRAAARDTIAPTIDMLIQHPLNRVLVDFRQVSGNPSTMDRYAFSVSLAEKFSAATRSGADVTTRFAFVGHEPMVDKRRFGETVAVNRGLNLKVLESMEEALNWLGIAPDYDAAPAE